jgi:mRNA deadenylase 3'-5' endonuclease subunit Ccr4
MTKFFKIIHWNALADSLSDGFPHVDKSLVTWQHRKPLIINNVMKEMADIICLVEIDEKHQDIFDELMPDYTRYYVKKNSDDNQEGCMVLINTKRFNVLNQSSIQMLDKRSQIAIIMKLQDVSNGYIFNLVSTHLKAKPGFEETRLEQCKSIMDVIQDEDCVFCGDFNDVPDSLFYNYLTKECGFKDVYQNTDREYTTCKKRAELVCRVIDYIFIRSKQLDSTKTIDAPNLKELPEIGLPSEKYPSDHVLIGANLFY